MQVERESDALASSSPSLLFTFGSALEVDFLLVFLLIFCCGIFFFFHLAWTRSASLYDCFNFDASRVQRLT